MESHLLIPQITPKLKGWSCKVIVSKKLNIRDSQNSPGTKFKPIILQDEAGNKVQAMAYKNDLSSDIEMFDERLKLYSTYLISNANVSVAKDMFKVPDEKYKFIWSLNRKTLIQDIDVEHHLDVPISSEIETTPFGELYDYKSQDKQINILGVIISKLPREFIVTKAGQKKANEFVIVDEELKPVIFTFWGNFVDNQGVEIDKELRSGNFPIIHGRRISVRPYQGISLSTRFDSFIEVNPFGQRAQALNDWKACNSTTFERLIVQKAYNDAITTLANPLHQPISQISAVKTSFDQSKPIWVKAKIKLIDNGNPIYYVGCNFCDKKVNSNEGVQFRCMFCGNANAISIKRYRLPVKLFDETDTIEATLFNRYVDKLLSLTNTEVGNDGFDFEKIQHKLDAPTFAIELRCQTQDQEGRPRTTYTVASISKDSSSSSITPTKKKLNFGESSHSSKDKDNEKEKRPRRH